MALLAAPLLAGAGIETTPVAHTIAPSDAGGKNGTAQLVRYIVEYTRWPVKPDPIVLCVVGQANYALRPGVFPIAGGRNMRERQLSLADLGSAQSCNALYLGNMSLASMRNWTAAVRGGAIVTIAERDPDCASEAMICLIRLQRTISFEINVDAVSRSKVRIDPRVLRLSAGT